MEFHTTFHGIPWNPMEVRENNENFHGIPWTVMDIPWNSIKRFVEVHGRPLYQHVLESR